MKYAKLIPVRTLVVCMAAVYSIVATSYEVDTHEQMLVVGAFISAVLGYTLNPSSVTRDEGKN